MSNRTFISFHFITHSQLLCRNSFGGNKVTNCYEKGVLRKNKTARSITFRKTFIDINAAIRARNRYSAMLHYRPETGGLLHGR
jgi:hypothetical protein